MITDLTVTNYRCFESFKLSGLTRVNLFVGKNNSGKTALLEGIQFLASGGEPTVLLETARRRGETPNSVGNTKPIADVSSVFYGYKVSLDSTTEISSGGASIKLQPRIVEEEDLKIFESLLRFSGDEFSCDFTLTIDRTGMGERRVLISPLDASGAAVLVSTISFLRFVKPVVNAFLSSECSLYPVLVDKWDDLIETRSEEKVYRAMRLLDENLEDIQFLRNGRGRHQSSLSGAMVGLKGHDKRVALGSMGEGVFRLLSLAISLIHTKNGSLCIDEIGTGLHYSLMADLWELVVKTAIESNTQVFATTHSADCVRGLGVLCARYPELQGEVSVHKIVSGLEEGIPFGGNEVLNAIEHDIELR